MGINFVLPFIFLTKPASHSSLTHLELMLFLEITLKKTSHFEIPLSKISINVQDMITSPGKYKINLSLIIKPTKTVITKTHSITSMTKIKISNDKLSIENLGDKTLNEKETQIEYPKRTFRSMKANQDSVIHLKVKLNYVISKFMVFKKS